MSNIENFKQELTQLQEKYKLYLAVDIIYEFWDNGEFHSADSRLVIEDKNGLEVGELNE